MAIDIQRLSGSFKQLTMEEVSKLKMACWWVKQEGAFKGISEGGCGESICPFNNSDRTLRLAALLRSASEYSLSYSSTGK